MSLQVAAGSHRVDAAPRAPRGAGVVGVARWVLQVVAWLLILSSLAVLAAAVLVPRLGGATPYSILTGSMRPDLPPGTLVVVRPVDPTDIGIGTVITYQLHSGDPTVVTHRVVAVRTTLDGELELQTQGDANDVPDEEWVRPEQVRGELWYAVPVLGRLNNVLNGDERQLLVYAAAAGLGLYAVRMFVSVGRDRLRRRDA
jgi:signal peptidase